MEIDYDTLPEILVYFLGIFMVFFVLYKKYIFSIFDPLFIFIFTNAFASVLVITVLNDDYPSMVNFFVCQLCLFFGFSIVQKDRITLSGILADQVKFEGTDVLKLTTYLLIFVYIVGNLALFFTKGLPLLSDKPSASKVANFQGGFGIFRKINWAAGGFVTVSLIYIYISQRNKTHLILLLIVAFFTALEGSKSSLLRILVSFAFIVYHPFFFNKKEIFQSLKKYIPIGLGALFLIFFTVLAKENEDSEQVMFAFLKRFLFTGDAILYYYTPVNQNYFARYTYLDYPGYIFNTVLGFLRLTPYKEAFGNEMVLNAIPDFLQADVIVGPNTSFYIDGKIFFGYYGAFIYSFIIGVIYSLIRKKFFTYKNKSAFTFVFLCCLCVLSSNILVDTSLFITVLFDTCFFVFPIYLLSYFIINKKIKLKIFF